MSQSQFRYILNSFCVQAVSGVYMSLFRKLDVDNTCKHKINAIINDENSNNYLLSFYINNCWQSYHKKNDEFVTNTVDSLLNLKIINHVSCIFNIFFEYCKHLMKNFKVLATTYQFKKMSVDDTRDMLNVLLNKMVDNDIIYDSCDSDCNVYKYVENEDFVIINQ